MDKGCGMCWTKICEVRLKVFGLSKNQILSHVFYYFCQDPGAKNCWFYFAQGIVYLFLSL